MEEISSTLLNELRTNYEADAKARVVRNALTKNDLNSISRHMNHFLEHILFQRYILFS